MRETMQPGKYLCKITSHSLAQSKKKDWQVVIKFQPILFEPRDTKEPVAIESPQTCTYWGWLTDKGKQWVVKALVGGIGKGSTTTTTTETTEEELDF